MPGLITVAGVVCTASPQTCQNDDQYALVGVLFGGLYYLLATAVPPLVVLVCMIVQIVSLRRTLSDLPHVSTAGHVSTTVLLVSLLYFLCNAAYITLLAVWIGVVQTPWGPPKTWVPSCTVQGAVVGLAEFTLPLLNAALFPLILILRKPELRRRYVSYLRSMACHCRRNIN